MIPKLAGAHHLKLPVADLDRSIQWYGTRLGYQVAIEFREHGRRTGVAMTHPDGGPDLALNLNPERAKASAGFDYFSIGVPDLDGIEALAAHLSGLGESHAGVHFATIGWILPMLHDPDGHEVRFYTMESHTVIDPAAPLVIDDAIATAKAKEAQWHAERAAFPSEIGKTTGTTRSQSPEVTMKALVLTFNGPLSDRLLAASDRAGRDRLLPEITSHPGMRDEFVNLTVLRQPGGASLIVITVQTETGLQLLHEIVGTSKLLPGEEQTLLPGPDREEVFDVVASYGPLEQAGVEIQ